MYRSGTVLLIKLRHCLVKSSLFFFFWFEMKQIQTSFHHAPWNAVKEHSSLSLLQVRWNGAELVQPELDEVSPNPTRNRGLIRKPDSAQQ